MPAQGPIPPERPLTDTIRSAGRVKAASARLPLSGYLDFSVDTSIPIGQFTFCKTSPSECFNDMMPQRIHLTQRVLDVISAVNREVNHDIKPMEDMDQYGKDELWAYPVSGAGDCEDYQLLKQKNLRDAGFPQSALRHAVVNDTHGAGHDVLLIRTDRGDFVIDNLSDEIRTPEQTHYKFLKILSSKSDYQWESFSGQDWKNAYTVSRLDRDSIYTLDAQALASVERQLNGDNVIADASAPLPQPRPDLNRF
jgi:predicted transglutaminase-like cysteine proteinase